MRPGFSERTFEFCFNAEFCKVFGGLLATHPYIPSQRKEKDLGYDVEFKIKAGSFTGSLFHHMMLDYVFHLQNVMQLRDRGLAESVDFEAWDVHVVGSVATTGDLAWWEIMGDYFTDTIRGHIDAELAKLGHVLPSRGSRNPHEWIQSTPWLGNGAPTSHSDN